MKSLCGIVLAVALIAHGSLNTLEAQGLTGQVSGTVTDSGGGVLPGATVVIKNAGTNQTRETVTDADGAFLFPDLLAGKYDVTVTVAGFKTYEQKGIDLASTERVGLRAIALEVGGVAETVTVQAESVQVQTTTAARSGLITRENIEDIALKGRDFAGMLKLLPGVVDVSSREAPGWGSMGGLSINGRSGGFNFSYDGVTNKDTGSNSGNYAAPALDSIAEVRVQTSNFQAEYGRSSGATITVITRSGSKDWRGSAAYYKRDTKLNGNEFRRREQCGLGVAAQCDPPLYKFDNEAWTLGGPVLIPGTKFNRDRNKLFFFFSQDLLQRTDPGGLNQRRMPTELERRGDFSQTFDAQGRRVNIRDPLLPGNCAATTGGPACFAGNRIPASRFDAVGSALLNLFPVPNADDPTGGRQYNYVFQTVQDWPRNDQVLRVDWNVAPQTTAYGRLQWGYEKRAGGVSFLGSTGAGWPQQPSKYEIDTVSYVNTLLHTFNQSTFAEFTVGVNWAHQYTSALDQAAIDNNDRTKVLPGFRQFFPSANPDNLLPQASFGGGIPGTIGSFNVEARWPFFGYNTLFNISGNLTKVKGAHNLKTGIFVEHTTRPAQRSSTFNGALNFNVDGSNPLNTNLGFANALLGAVTQYQEANGHPDAHGQFMNTEFYVQDNWRLKRNFTIDAGVRFYYITPTQSEGDEVAQFEPGQYNAAQAPLLYQPTRVGNTRAARNPLTNEVLPFVYVGRLVPNSGNFTNGMVVYDGTPQQKNPFKVAPRLGFAWDVTGDGRTAVRGGAGVFYDRYSDDNILDLVELPPLLQTFTTNYTTVTELLASPLTATPTAVRRIEEFVPPVVYNWSLGVQRDIGWQLVGDVAYVGNAARDQLITRQINGQPYGYAYQTSSLDPTNESGGQAQPLPNDLLRPNRGYGSIGQREFTGYSDYHSMQFSVNRRRASDGLSVGASYTYQMVNKNLGAIDPFVSDNRARNYTSSGRRPHSLVINYSYEVPNLSRKWDNIVVKAILDNWQVSGITSMLSGNEQGVGYGYSNVPTGTLAGTGAIDAGGSRPDIVCDPRLPRGERTFERQFKTECIAPPSDQFRLGNARGDELQGPGFINWDISFFKNVPMGGTRRLQLRVELYNAFNTDQWNCINYCATFDFYTGAQTNVNFGRLSGSTFNARRIQLGARFMF
ncbi:MAG: carboxypeptidase regulatory-like domain-containing protein [Acidobacteriota bacterium]|nr:carboxypeptidase regulatory-like domain-containing protein [Acidobacteriota bacterium]